MPNNRGSEIHKVKAEVKRETGNSTVIHKILGRKFNKRCIRSLVENHKIRKLNI